MSSALRFALLPRVSFRCLKLGEEAFGRLSALFPEVKGRPREEDPSRIVAVLPLASGRDYTALPDYVRRERLEDVDCDFFVSAVGDRPAGIVETPQFVVDLILQVWSLRHRRGSRRAHEVAFGT